MSGWLSAWDGLVLWYFLALNTSYLLLIGLATLAVVRYLRQSRILQDRALLRYHQLVKPVSILVPAYNEERTVVESVRSLLNLSYPEFEVIVVNDGSKDGTLRQLIEHFALERIL